MQTTTDERGLLNNFATEPKVYLAQTPSQEQKRRYALQGAIATLLVVGLVFTSFAIS